MHPVSQKSVQRLCGRCGGAVDLIISIFTQLHMSGLDLEFETLLESIWQVVAGLWQRKGKMSGCFKNYTSYQNAPRMSEIKYINVSRKGWGHLAYGDVKFFKAIALTAFFDRKSY